MCPQLLVGRVSKSATSNELTTFVEYNDLGQVVSQKAVSASQALLSLHTYEYDQNGNRTKDTTLDGSYVQYEYDSVNELLSEKYYTALGTLSKTLAYTYDKQGNRLTKKVTVCGSTTTTNRDGDIPRPALWHLAEVCPLTLHQRCQ